jgi:hypothetical protein
MNISGGSHCRVRNQRTESLGGRTVTEYIQIAEYESDDIDALVRAANSAAIPDGVPKPISVMVVRDRDHPGTYATIHRSSLTKRRSATPRLTPLVSERRRWGPS